MAKLFGKVALITGASGGIGSAIAKALAAEGCAVALHYNSDAKNARGLEKKLTALGYTAKVFKENLLSPNAPRRLIAACLRAFGELHILVNNAGAVVGADHFSRLDEKAWAATMRLNAEAPFFLTREAFRAMEKSGGRVINISSVAAQYGGSSRSMHYGAAKAALESMTRGFAREGAAKGILVNAIRAGVIDTPFHGKFPKDMKKRVALIPMKRMGRPQEVAALALHLASDGGYITGQVLSVTGGE